MADEPTCPRCSAPRGDGAECPRCGVIYAKAAQRRAREQHASELVVTAVAEEPAPAFQGTDLGGMSDFSGGVDLPSEDDGEQRGELLVRMVAIPAALGAFWLLEQSRGLHGLIRTFLSMWVHELGHAVMGWLCGLSAVPGPWRTSIADERSVVVVLVFLAAWGTALWYAVQLRRWGWVATAGALVVLQLICPLLPLSRAHALVTFAGDGGLFVLGAALMLTVYAPPESALVRGQLRFGLLAIGAAAFIDGVVTWWSVKQDWANLPLGDIQGVGLSDPAVLVERHQWTEVEILHRYLGLAALCAVFLAAVWAAQLVIAQRRGRE